MDSFKGAHQCHSCKKTFSQKSSLVRHLKLCNRAIKPSSLRQKSCQRCASSKARCDLRRPVCGRCTLRGISCVYASIPDSDSRLGDSSPSPPSNHYDSSAGTSMPPEDNHMCPMLDVFSDELLDNFPLDESVQGESSMGLIPRSFGSLAYNAALTHTSDFPGLGDPWGSSLFSTTPPLVEHSMQTLLRALRTWPRMLAKGLQLPPIFHDSIMNKNSVVSLPLANCCTLVKMWNGQFNGTSALVQDTILKETKNLLRNFKAYDEADSLAALQAVTIYAIMLVFPTKNQKSIPFLDMSIFTDIQEVVRHTALSGMVLQEETEHCIPSWEAWIHVTSKRRSVFALYLLHWAYSVYHRVASFNCEELSYIPAPAPKYLWQATSEAQWEGLYRRWLAQWNGHEFMQHEFMCITPGPFLDERAQLWLEDADEFGMLFASIFNATDREAYGFLPRCFDISTERTASSGNSSVHS